MLSPAAIGRRIEGGRQTLKQARQALYRARRRIGVGCVTVEFDHTTVQALRRHGKLHEAEAYSPDEIAEAIAKAVDEWRQLKDASPTRR